MTLHGVCPPWEGGMSISFTKSAPRGWSVVMRLYRVPFSQRSILAEHLHDMLKKDVIGPSKSFWVSYDKLTETEFMQEKFDQEHNPIFKVHNLVDLSERDLRGKMFHEQCAEIDPSLIKNIKFQYFPVTLFLHIVISHSIILYLYNKTHFPFIHFLIIAQTYLSFCKMGQKIGLHQTFKGNAGEQKTTYLFARKIHLMYFFHVNYFCIKTY